jgi:short-subunit dehydrogenase
MAEASLRKLALITGASSGIGAAFASAYGARGFDLALVARRKDRLEAAAAKLAEAHGVEAFALPADLAQVDAQATIMTTLASRGRRVDVLVNNAGFGIPRIFTDAPWREQQDFLMSMALAPCALAYAAIPGMAERGWGRIINVASVAGFAPGVAGNTLYPGVKSLMIKFSQALDAEYRAAGLKVTALCPGTTRTNFAAEAGYQHLVGGAAQWFAQTPQQVADAAIRGNESGRLVVIPGWTNRLAVAAMRALPEPLVRAVINAGAAKYRLGPPGGSQA